MRSALLLIFLPSMALAYEPESAYSTRVVRGFTVKIHETVAEHDKDAEELLREIDGQLGHIEKVLTADQLETLRKIRIWVEWDRKPRGAAEFHVSAGFLKANDYHPDKLHGVEISNTRNFVAWSRKAQPWCMMHELAHAYHFTVLGEKHEPLQAAYRQAIERKLYEKVKHVNGRTEKAYAATNPAEYFAELTEAYLGKNDFEPFIRRELEKHDPVGYRLMQTVWEQKP